MRLQPKLCLTMCAVAVLAAMALPGVARAQLDDPGLAPPPPPPPPRPAPPPPPPPRVVPSAAPAPAPIPAPAPAVVPPGAVMAAPGTEGPVKEEVTEKVETKRDVVSDDVWQARLAAPALVGATGLFRVVTAETGAPASFRVALHIQGFTQDNFLLSPDPSGKFGDSNSRFLGDVVVAFTGPDVTFARNLELYFGIFNSSNQNKREIPPGEPSRTDPEVILALADVGVGLKGAGEVVRGFSIGANVGVRFLNSISGVAANLDATNVDLNLLAMLDVRRINSKAPLRLHLNVGYLVDNSLKLLPAQCSGTEGLTATNGPCIKSRLVETFAYGINSQRFRLAFAVELPFRPHYGNGRIFGIDPFIEYHLDVATGDGDTTVAGALFTQYDSELTQACRADPACAQANLDKRNRVNNPTAQWITLGLRLRPVGRLLIDLGFDIGLQNVGYQFGPPLPAWNVLAGLGYTYDFVGGRTKNVTRTVTRSYEVNRRPPEGRLSGTVLDVKTGKPIAGAIVRYGGGLTAQATDEKGQFVSYGLPPGQVQMQVTHPDYETVSGTPMIKADEVKSLTVRLKALPPREGKVRVKVIDEKNNPLPGATGRLVCVNGANKEALYDGEQLVVSVPPGVCTLSVEANQFLGKDRQVTVAANGDQVVEVQLHKRPKTSHVEVTRDEIKVKSTIHFATNEAVILPDGQQLLDEVVDVMSKNPQIRRLSIEGHTDNVGDPQRNKQLSKDRARAVLDYLIRNGIAADRLVSEGFGQEKPIVPNTSASQRAKNRRVEFRIVDQGAPIMQ